METNPFETPKAELVVPGTGNPQRYVGFWLRALASIVDGVLLMLVTTPLNYLLFGEEYFSNTEAYWGPMDLIINVLFPIMAVMLMWRFYAATPGKMLFKAKIVDARTGGDIAVWQIIVRYLSYILSSLPLGLGYLWAAWDPRKQCWHDKLAKTVVVRPGDDPEFRAEFAEEP